jgi:hypothetical protein
MKRVKNWMDSEVFVDISPYCRCSTFITNATTSKQTRKESGNMNTEKFDSGFAISTVSFVLAGLCPQLERDGLI